MNSRKAKRTSISSVGLTGKPAPSWVFDEHLSDLANRCFIACVNEYAKRDGIRVYWNNASSVYGRCFYEQRIITLARNEKAKGHLHTLAHELAHFRVKSHGPKHEALTEELYQWILQEAK